MPDTEEQTNEPLSGDASTQTDRERETTNGSLGPIGDPGSGGSADDPAGNAGRA
jgi:hypothetical protein